jgi:hypothetical protein
LWIGGTKPMTTKLKAYMDNLARLDSLIVDTTRRFNAEINDLIKTRNAISKHINQEVTRISKAISSARNAEG